MGVAKGRRTLSCREESVVGMATPVLRLNDGEARELSAGDAPSIGLSLRFASRFAHALHRRDLSRKKIARARAVNVAEQNTETPRVVRNDSSNGNDNAACDNAPHPQDSEDHLARTRDERLLLLLLALADRAQVALREDRLAPNRDRVVAVLQLPLDCAIERAHQPQRIRSECRSQTCETRYRKEGPLDSQASTLARIRSSTLHS